MGGLQDKSSGGQGNPPRRAGRKPPTPASQKPAVPLGTPQPSVKSPGMPALPSRQVSNGRAGSLLLGMVMGSLIALLGVAAILISLNLARTVNSPERPDSPEAVAAVPLAETPEEASSPQPVRLPTGEKKTSRPAETAPAETTQDAPSSPPLPKAKPADDGPEELAERDMEEPAAEETGAEEMRSEVPGDEEPGDEEPGREEPGREEPGREEPGREEPGREEPGREEPGREEPGDEEPGREELGGEEPGGEEPGREEPGREEPGREVFADILERDRRLLLPELGVEGPVELAKVLVDSPFECELSLHGAEVVLETGRSLTVDQVDVDDGRKWNVSMKVGIGKARPIAVFSLLGRSLTFQWNTARSLFPGVEYLRYCLLTLKSKGESVSCFLSEPRDVESPKLSFHRQQHVVGLPLEARWQSQSEHLRIDLEFANFPRHESDRCEDLRKKEVATVRFPHAGVGEFVKLEVWLEIEPQCGLFFRTSGYPAWLNSGTDEEKAVAIDRSWLVSQEALVRKLRERASKLKWSSDRRAALKTIEPIADWLEDVRSLLEMVETNGQIAFQIYVEIEGEKIVLLQSSDQEDTD